MMYCADIGSHFREKHHLLPETVHNVSLCVWEHVCSQAQWAARQTFDCQYKVAWMERTWACPSPPLSFQMVHHGPCVNQFSQLMKSSKYASRTKKIKKIYFITTLIIMKTILSKNVTTISEIGVTYLTQGQLGAEIREFFHFTEIKF